MAFETLFFDEYHELVAMQRVFREAKFCLEPDDEDISGSPIVAKLYCRFMEIMISADVAREGEVARVRWDRWLAIDETRNEWKIASERAKSKLTWVKWTRDEKCVYVRNLFSPFILTSDLISQFIDMVDVSHNSSG